MFFLRLKSYALAALLLVALTALAAPAAAQTTRCLPTCNPADGRFIAIAGSNLITLSDVDLDFTISVPEGSATFQIGIFDGDSGLLDLLGVSHWDTGVLASYEYTLFADPAANGTGTTVVELVPGFPSISSATMPDNGWIDFTIPTSPLAQTPGGNYFYRLNVRLTVAALTTVNAFKLRSSAIISGVTLDPTVEPFSYIANLRGTADIQIVYPAFPSATPSNYDGTFRFYFDVPVTQTDLSIWDGDFDRGKFNGTDLDTDDPDTPGAPFLPDWATEDAISEAAVGASPFDDRDPAGAGIFNSKPPSVQYEVHFPDGQVFLNPNPSGNQEWEQFRISTDPFNPSLMDYSTPNIPPGVYEFRGIGVDMQNLNALLLPFRVLCVEEDGTPCVPLRPYRIGDTVFLDSDGDGNQDPGEPGIEGVVLQLRDEAGVLLATATTDEDGKYTFPAESFTYTVEVAPENFNSEGGGVLEGCEPTTELEITDTVIDDNVLDYDFGIVCPGAIGDRVWLDFDDDGVQDPEEPGIDGVLLELLDSDGNVVTTSLTSDGGLYSFTDVGPGTYTVRIDVTSLPEGLVPTFDRDGLGTPHEASVTLGPAEIVNDVDFGYRGTASLGDRLWYDLDADGVQDAGETGINGVTVELYDFNGNLLASTTTAGDGNYSFANLPADLFTVTVKASTLPAGLVQTFDLDGTGTANTAEVTLGAGEDRDDVDFGYRGTASLGDRLWSDIDGDGVQEAGEEGINGVTVELYDGGGNLLASTTTAGDGNYSFANLPAGTYSVRVNAATLPAGSAPTFDYDGIGTPHAATVTLAAGATETAVDFGYRGTASLGDRLWYDLDADGVQEAGEAGINGVTVQLLDGGGNTLASTTTAGDGNYSFGNLSPGTYTVRVVAATLPAGLAPTFDLDGTGTPNTAVATLGAAGRNDVDFGYRGTASLGDRLWYDLDADGVQEAGEAGINGVTVQLFDGNGNLVASATTAGDGNYSFGNLLAGDYTVRVVAATLPAGLVQTYDLDGTGSADAATVSLAAGATRTDVDFGYRGNSSLGDRLWNDVDGDGAQDAGEAGLTGVTVELLNGGGTVLATTTTGADGLYTFPNLSAGSYIVRVVSSTLPAGFVPTYDLDGIGTAHTATATLAAGQNRTDVDFGYRTPPVSCTAGYFKDHFSSNSFSNNDGTLSWAGAWIESDTAGAGPNSGNVTVGTPVSGYLILRDSPDTGTQPSAARQANLAGFASATLSFSFHVRAVDPDDAAVLEVSSNGGASYTVLETFTGLTGNQTGSRTYDISAFLSSNTRIRFRISNNYGASDEYFKVDWVRIDATCTPSPQTGSIGNRVWLDTDGDGTQDSGETGINGVTVELLNGSGTVIGTATTAGDGNYTFSGLAAGSYSVRVVTSTLPAGAVQTYDLDGTGTANVAAVTLAPGQNRTDADFGYRVPAACTPGYFKDHFSSKSFSNNDGTLSWAGAWIESDTAGAGVNSGNVTVGTPVSGYLILRDSPDTGTQPSAARQANLSSFASATLSFAFHVRAVDPDDAAVIEVSSNGGASYTVLETFTGLTGNQTGTRTYDISAFLAGNTRIRFRISRNYGASDEYFKIDWVRIDGNCTPPNTAPGTGTIGYWKTHPEDWPVQQITVGGVTYSKSQAISWMGTASRGDKTIDLFKQLVAAKLNVLAGNDSSCIQATINAADSWLAANPLGSNVKSSSNAWATGGPLHTRLDDYNNGLLCAPHRD